MVKKSALLPAVTDKQGKNQNDKTNIIAEQKFCKSKEQLTRDYLVNTFTRFQLQHFAQNKLIERGVASFNSNYSKCHRVALGGFASLVRNPLTFRAYYNGVVTCANPLLCPVCAPRIMGKRSAEIKSAVHQWLNEDSQNTCYMLTFTFAHTADDNLSDLLQSFKSALVSFWKRGDINRILTVSGRVGRITSTEIQCSQKNGWHPHQHVLLFCQASDFNEKKLAGYWLNSLEASGLSGLSDIAFNMVEARSAELYLTKISSEMALGNLKQGRTSGHYSPMQLLDEARTGSEWAINRFCELYSSVKGLHSLYWSRGLKARFGIGEVSDSDITNGTAQPELVKFLDLIDEGFSRLSVAEKALLRNYAALGDYERASALLVRLNIEFYKDSCLQTLNPNFSAVK